MDHTERLESKGSGRSGMAKQPNYFHRVTPIPDETSLVRRVSGTPSVGSIAEEPGEGFGSYDPKESLQEQRSAARRLPLVAESLEQIPELSVGRSQGFFKHRNGLQGSRSASPSASESDDTGIRQFRSDSLHRTTPIPGEAAGALSGQSSFSSVKKHRRLAPTISEDEEQEPEAEDQTQDISNVLYSTSLSERQDSLRSSGSLHRPTPIPLDMVRGSNAILTRRSGGRQPVTPTILEVDAESGSAEETEKAPETPAKVPAQRRVGASNTTDNSLDSLPRYPTASGKVEATELQDTARDNASGAPYPQEPVAIVAEAPSLQVNEPRYDSVSSHNAQPVGDLVKVATEEDTVLPRGSLHGKQSVTSEVYTPLSGSSSITPLMDNRETERDLVGVARFLRMTPELSRQTIGEILGENNERCIRVLDLFTASFDLKGLTFEAALREYLESFRLPGESQKICRILEAWSRQFYQQCEPGVFKSQDAVFTLAFSLILLNTDLHNSQVKKKMTKEEFVKNTAGLNEKTSFPLEFLEMLYTNIERRALKNPPAQKHQDSMGRTSSLPEPARKTRDRFESPQKVRKSSIFCF